MLCDAQPDSPPVSEKNSNHAPINERGFNGSPALKQAACAVLFALSSAAVVGCSPSEETAAGAESSDIAPYTDLSAPVDTNVVEKTTAAPAQNAAPATVPQPVLETANAAVSDTPFDEKMTFINDVCTGCHGPNLMSEGPDRTQAEWREVIIDMIAQGAQVFPDEIDQLALYLDSVYHVEGGD